MDRDPYELSQIFEVVGQYNQRVLAGFENVSCVYVIRGTITRHTKVGHTTRVHKRIATLMTAASEPLRVEACIATPHRIWLEKHLHALLSPYRIHGEWFAWDECVDRRVAMFTAADPPIRPFEDPVRLANRVIVGPEIAARRGAA